MRVTKYLRSDGEDWIVAKIRHSPQIASARLDDKMLEAGWIRWSSRLRDRFNELKKKVARSNPTKFPNWKEVEIPMRGATIEDIPAGIHRKEIQLLDANGQPIQTSRPLTGSRPDAIIIDDSAESEPTSSPIIQHD